MRERVISVSQLVRYLKSKLDSDPLIQKILIEGEISNFTAHRSGHWYFSLKDNQSRISCVMFQSYAKTVPFLPKNGDKVIVTCSTSMFESAGNVQLYCTAMKPYGLGDLYVQLELLKEKLRKEGLFDAAHKQQLPSYPMRIGVIVGANTAAREDIMTTLKRRWPIAQVVEFHSLVQGERAHLELIAALLRADAAECDVLILARGGGSIEDLWAFNNEDLARYIYHLKTPIVTGIGHEVDFTIADFVADVRAATPTAAAETVSPDQLEVHQNLRQSAMHMKQAMLQRLREKNVRLEHLKQCSAFTQPDLLLEKRQMMLDYQNTQLIQLMQALLTEAQSARKSLWKCAQLMNETIKDQMNSIYETSLKMNALMQLNHQKQTFQLKHHIAALDAYSPLKILQRGFSIATKDAQTLISIEQVKCHDVIDLRLSDGNLICTVNEKGELS